MNAVFPKDPAKQSSSEAELGDALSSAEKPGSPLVSVLIPAYNVEKFISDCLDSVLCQQVDRMEVVVVDDGSTDGTSAILKRYADMDSRLRVFRQERGGPAAARNRLLDAARGKWIYFCDADDMLKSGALPRMLSVAERDGLDALFFSAEVTYDSPELERQFPEFKDRYSFGLDLSAPRSGQAFFAECIQAKEWKALLWLMLVRRKTVVDHALRFPTGNIADDAVFVMSIALHSGKVERIPDILYTRRVRDNSIMTTVHIFQNLCSFSQNIFIILDFASRLDLEPAAAKALGDRLDWTIRMARQYLFALSEEEAALFAEKSPVFSVMMTAFSKTRTEEEWSRNNAFIASLKETLSRREDAIASLKDIVARRDNSIASLKEGVARREDAIASLKEVLARREGAIASLKDAVARRDNSIASLKGVVSRREASIASLKDVVARGENSILSLKAAVARSDSENARLRDKMARCEMSLSASRKALASSRNEILALRHSLSFRMGKALLFVPRLLLDLVHRGGRKPMGESHNRTR